MGTLEKLFVRLKVVLELAVVIVVLRSEATSRIRICEGEQ